MNEYPRQPEKASRGMPVIIGVVLLVLVPVMVYGCRGELDRWRAAVVMERYLDGDKQQGIVQLTQIAERLPNNIGLQATLARWMLDDERPEDALELINAIPEEKRDARIQAIRQDCLLASGRPEEALEAYRAANPANINRGYEQKLQHRNTLSYLQALAGQELRLALKNSRYVVNETAGAWNHLEDVKLPTHLQVYFCATILYREQAQRTVEQGDTAVAETFTQTALDQLSPVIEELRRERNVISRLDPQAISEALLSLFGMQADEQETKLPQVARKKEENAHALAAFLTLRALIYQDLGEQESSWADRRAIMELGYDPEMVASKFPELQLCAVQLLRLAPFLDTRGCVQYQMNVLESALVDLNAAVAAQRTIVDVPFAAPRTRFEASLDPREQYEFFVRGPKKSLAVLLYHRSWILRELGAEKSAQADAAEIRELGFKPGRFLF
ncbi:MAG: tetratricopeptide repeat protein [Pirellulaceae bacterium]